MATHTSFLVGLPWLLRWYRTRLQCGGHGFDPKVGKIPWRREPATHSSSLAWRIPWTEEYLKKKKNSHISDSDILLKLTAF